MNASPIPPDDPAIERLRHLSHALAEATHPGSSRVIGDALSENAQDSISAGTQADTSGSPRPIRLAQLARRHTLGALVTTLTHELSQPLSAIGMYGGAAAHLVHAGRLDGGELLDVLQLIEGQVKRANEMLARVRTFRRLDQAPGTTIDLYRTVADAVALVQPLANGKQIKVSLELPVGPVTVAADGMQIGQVLLNLLFNAIEALDQANRSERQVWVSVVPESEGGRVTVRDTGPGIGPGEALRIFDCFTSDKSEGCGLGLALSRALIERLGGRLWADPDASTGATFHLWLPWPGSQPGVAAVAT
jgi:signal transduction histidine kinase